MYARTFFLPIAFLLLALAGCQKPTDDPARAFRLFVDRVQAGDTDGAWDLLSRESQEQLTDLVKRRAAGSEGAIPEDPKEALFGSATLARPIEAVEVVKADERRAVLVVTHPGGERQEVVMVREEDGWRLSLEAPPAGP
jgi:hypothetical protein